MSNTSRFETTSRPLENFLYVHDIHHFETYKAEDGMTTWCYERDTYLEEVLDEYKRVLEHRRARRA